MASAHDTSGTVVDDARLDVLHVLMMKHVTDAAGVAAILRRAEADVAPALAGAADDGDVIRLGETFALTPAGRERLAATYAERFGDARVSAETDRQMRLFDALNSELLGVLTNWQTIAIGGRQVPNDHGDADYDASVLDRLGGLHDRAEPLLLGLPGLRWMDLFVERLGEALDRATVGESEYVSGAAVPSYHTVWHEMHESILLMLGRQRDA